MVACSRIRTEPPVEPYRDRLRWIFVAHRYGRRSLTLHFTRSTPLPRQPPDEVRREAGRVTILDRMPALARSNEEAHLFLDLYPCDCGGDDERRDSGVRLDGATWIVRYTCVCAACGRPRVVEFRQPDVPARPPTGGWSVGTHPSELLDAGEWLWVADRYAGAPATPDGLTPAEIAQAHADLVSAAEAVGEVLKFVPDGASEVPDEALWSNRGSRVFQEDPRRFLRPKLEHLRDLYRRLAAAHR
jgi:hypothetical protein